MMLTYGQAQVRSMTARVCSILLDSKNAEGLRRTFDDGRLNINNAGEQNARIIRENLVRLGIFRDGDFQ